MASASGSAHPVALDFEHRADDQAEPESKNKTANDPALDNSGNESSEKTGRDT